MYTTRAGIVLVLVLAIGLCACSTLPGARPATQSLTPITLQLSWTHQAQFAGFYAADQRGYYAAEGLAVRFVEGGSSTDPIAALLDGSAQFALGTGELALQTRARGYAVVAVAAVFRRQPRVYVALASSGITRPREMMGKIIAVPRTAAPMLVTMMRRLGIADNTYTVVESISSLDQLTSGQVDVRSVYLNNEVLTLRAAGYDLSIIYPDDYGIHSYSDVLLAPEGTVVSQPDLVLRFVRASLKGWAYAIENPNAVGQMILTYNTGADAAQETAKIEASIPLINTGEDFIGWMRADVWQAIARSLSEQGILTQPIDVGQVYTLDFVKQIYGR